MVVPVFEYLRVRQQELVGAIERKQSELAPLLDELAHVECALHAIAARETAEVVERSRRQGRPGEGLPAGALPRDDWTIKDLVRVALRDHLRDGATSQELLGFFKAAWGRTIARSSLSPQLSRLQRDGEIALEGQRWRRAANGSDVLGSPPGTILDIGQSAASPESDRISE